jgi:hypothetical protein
MQVVTVSRTIERTTDFPKLFIQTSCISLTLVVAGLKFAYQQSPADRNSARQLVPEHCLEPLDVSEFKTTSRPELNPDQNASLDFSQFACWISQIRRPRCLEVFVG